MINYPFFIARGVLLAVFNEFERLDLDYDVHCVVGDFEAAIWKAFRAGTVLK